MSIVQEDSSCSCAVHLAMDLTCRHRAMPTTRTRCRPSFHRAGKNTAIPRTIITQRAVLSHQLCCPKDDTAGGTSGTLAPHQRLDPVLFSRLLVLIRDILNHDATKRGDAGRLGRRSAHHHVTHGTCRVGHRMTHTCFPLLPPPCIPARHHLSHLLASAAVFRQKQICASIGEAKHRLASAIPGTLPRHITPGEIHRGIDTTIHRSLIRTQPVGLGC